MSELYTEENCKLVGEWLFRLGLLHWYDQATIQKWFPSSKESPELIREALGKDGIYVFQIPAEPDSFEVHIFVEGSNGPEVWVDWDMENDPTGRHALFAATVHYMEDGR